MFDTVMDWIRSSGLVTGTIIILPLALGLLVSLIVTALQAMTSLHDPSISAIPRLLIVGVTLWILGPWMAETLVAFATEMFSHGGFSTYGG